MSYEWTPGETVRIKEGVTDPVQGMVLPGCLYQIEGLWQDVAGISWMNANGNPACLQFAMRAAANHLPIDNNVLYGKIGTRGHLVHVSEIEGLDGTGEHSLSVRR